MNYEDSNIPKYICHKTVKGFKIKKIVLSTDNSAALLVPEKASVQRVEVSLEYIKQHAPYAGGYYVLYENNYESFSPPKPFEKGYTSTRQADASVDRW